MPDTLWHQVNIAYPGGTGRQREHHAVTHLARVLPAANAAGFITSWWFIRKGTWRIRYLPSEQPQSRETARELLTHGVAWTHDIYEPETHAFGGTSALTAAHTLFHHDSQHLLTYLGSQPTARREHSLILCTALMRAAALDLNEQGDVWARVVQHRSQNPRPELPSNAADREQFTNDVRTLLLGEPRAHNAWHTAFEDAGSKLQELREGGKLSRGLRAVIALNIIFHWNRLGLTSATQAQLAQAATDAIFTDRRRSPSRYGVALA